MQKRWIAHKLSLLVIITALPFFLCAQKIVYVDTSLNTFAPQIIYGEINLASCTDSLLDECGVFQHAFDIMIRSDGYLYGYGISNFPGDTVLFRDQFLSGAQGFPDAIIYDDNIQGLTCDENGEIYAAGTGIMHMNSDCCDLDETYLGDLPPGMQCLGDITYRKGKFYVAAVGNKLVEVDMKDVANSKVVMEFPPGTLPVHGLTTVQFDCDSVATYATGRATDHSEIYEIDFDNWTLTLVCDMPELAITGAASYTECMLPPCETFIDLDDDNSSYGFLGNYCSDTFCVSPMAVTDTDVVILSGPGYLDSITFELLDVLDLGSEYLSVNPGPNILVGGNNTPYLTLIDDGAAIDDFENAIQNVTYENVSSLASPGKRRVLVTGWVDGVPSPVSVAELPLSNSQMQTVATTADPSCYGFSDGNISVTTQGGIAPYNYTWEIPQIGNNVENLPAGNYPLVTIDSTGCTRLDTITLDDPAPLSADIFYPGPPAICDNSGQLEGAGTGGTGTLSYEWSNGVNGSLNADLGPGSYQLIIQDANGCTDTASYDIPAGDTVLVLQNETICDGSVISWNGDLYSTDTMVCNVTTLPSGCDSTSCLDVSVNPRPQIQLTTSGDLCEVEEVTLLANSQTSYLWNTGETTQEITITDPGVYTVSASNDFGCASSASIQIYPELEFDWYAESPSCFGENNGRIVIENSSGGNPPVRYSIDGISFSIQLLFDNLPPGDYLLIAEDAEGCRKEVDILLASPQEILVDAGQDTTIQQGESVNLVVTTNLPQPAVSWEPADFLDCDDCLSVISQPLHTIEYEVTVQDSNGCEASDFVVIQVEVPTGAVYIPNAFSPNGDGVNDTFTVYADAAVSRIQYLRVYNRWGGLVFENTDFLPNVEASGWNGRLGGKTLSPGVFVYKVKLEFADGREEIVSGDVILAK